MTAKVDGPEGKFLGFVRRIDKSQPRTSSKTWRPNRGYSTFRSPLTSTPTADPCYPALGTAPLAAMHSERAQSADGSFGSIFPVADDRDAAWARSSTLRCLASAVSEMHARLPGTARTLRLLMCPFRLDPDRQVGGCTSTRNIDCALPIVMNETDLCFTPATELADAIRAKKLSAVEITTAVLDRITALEPRLNAFAYLAAEEAMDAAAGGRSRAGHRRSDRAAARRAGDDQGPRGRARHADRIRHASAPRRGRGGGQRHGRAPAQRRRDHPRQDDDARVRLDGRQQQPADRHHAQSRGSTA